MMRMRSLLTVLLVLSCTSAASAEDTSADAILKLWLAQSSEVAAWRAQLGAARFDVVTASLWPNPQLGLSGSVVLAGREHPPDGIYNWGPSLTVPLPVFGQIGAREREAEAALSVAEMDIANTLWSRAADLEAAVVERAFDQAECDELAHNLDELSRIDRIVRTREAAGANPRYDVLRIATSEATFRAGLASAQLKRDQADAQIASLLAVPGYQTREITRDGLAPFTGPRDEATLLKLALARRPDVLLAERGVKAAVASANRYRAELRPLPSVNFGGYWTEKATSTSLQAGVALTLPIFDRNQGLIGRAEATATNQRELYSALRARVAAEVHGAVRAYEDSTQALSAFESSGINSTQEMLERAEVSYRAGGDFSILDLLDAYRSVWEARAQKLELERGLASAEADLRRAVATVVPSAERKKP